MAVDFCLDFFEQFRFSESAYSMPIVPALDHCRESLVRESARMYPVELPLSSVEKS